MERGERKKKGVRDRGKEKSWRHIIETHVGKHTGLASADIQSHIMWRDLDDR